MLAPFIYMYLFFFSLLVWQGVSTSGKNAGEPKIATCGCQLTAGYTASFYQISFINRWHRSSRDLRSSNHAYENSVSHCMYCIYVCVCLYQVSNNKFLMLHVALAFESIQYGKFLCYVSKQLHGNFLFVTVKCSGVPLIIWTGCPPPFIFQNTKVWFYRRATKQAANV